MGKLEKSISGKLKSTLMLNHDGNKKKRNFKHKIINKQKFRKTQVLIKKSKRKGKMSKKSEVLIGGKSINERKNQSSDSVGMALEAKDGNESVHLQLRVRKRICIY